MLLGTSEHSIDSKKRLFIPAKHREELGQTFVIGRDLRVRRLVVYSLEEWEKYIGAYSVMERKNAEKVLMYINSTAVQVTPDSQGRVILPQQLIDYAGITSDVVVAGAGHFDTIWSRELWDKANPQSSAEEIMNLVEEYGL